MKALELHEACSAADLSAERGILAEAPEVVQTQEAGRTPLSRAVASGQTDVVQALLLGGADPDTPSLGVPPLIQAVVLLQVQMVQTLLENGADPNLASEAGERPLQLATMRRHLDLMEALLHRGADPDLAAQGKTALELATALSFEPGIQLLLRYRASPLPTRKRSFLSLSVKPTELLTAYGSTQSLDPKIFSILTAHNAVQEPEDTSISVSTRLSVTREGSLWEWLHDLRLDEVYEKLMDNGFESLEELLAEQQSEVRLTQDLLRDIGVVLVGQQLVLLAALELEERSPEAVPVTCLRIPSELSRPSLDKWLASIGLELYAGHFTKAGFTDFGQVLGVMSTSHKVTEDILADMGIVKLGHRHRLLGSILELAKDTDPVALLFASGRLRSRPQPQAKCVVM